MMTSDVQRVEMVEEAALPPGEYIGRWKGQTVRLYKHESVRLQTANSVGDLDMACVVKVDESGETTVEIKL